MKTKRKRIIRRTIAELVSSPDRVLQSKLREAREAGLRLPRVKHNSAAICTAGIRGYETGCHPDTFRAL